METEAQATEERPKKRSGKLAWLLAGGVVVCVAAVAAVFFAKPAYDWYKAREAAGLAREAREHIEAQEWKEATRLLREAYQTSREEPEVVRTLAEFYGYGDVRRQREMLYELYNAGNHTAEDLRDLIEVELKFRNTAKAAELTASLFEDFEVERESLELAVGVAKAQNDDSKAETYLGKLRALAPDDLSLRLEMAKMQIGSTFEENVRAGWDEVYSLARDEGETGLEALRLIVRREPHYQGRLEEIEALMKKNPNATEADVLAALGWRYRATVSEEEKEKLLQDAIVERRGRAGEENRNFFAWLNRVQEGDQVLELLTEEEAYSSPELLAVYIGALLQGKRYDEMRKIFEPDAGLPEGSEISFVKAQCAIHLDLGTAKVREHLREAYEMALLEKQTEMLAQIANLAEMRGFRETAETVYEAMADIPKTSLWAYEKLLNAAKKRKDLKKMRAIVGKIEEKLPENPAAKKLSAYYDLLYGINLEGSLVDVGELSEKMPNDIECTAIHALARYRAGDLAGAAELCRGLRVGDLSPSYRAVYAAILGAAGEEVEAVVIAEKLPRSLLLEEEIALVSRWLPGN